MAKVYATPGVYIEEKSAFPNSAVPVATAVPVFIGYTEMALRGRKSLKNVPTRLSSYNEFLQFFGGAPKRVFTLDTRKKAAPAAAADAGATDTGATDTGATDAGATDAGGPAAATEVDLTATILYDLEPEKSSHFILHSCMRWFFANGGSDCYVISVGTYKEASQGVREEDLKNAIDLLLKEPEPTMLVIPEAVLTGTEGAMNIHQKMLQHCGQDMRNRVAILDVYPTPQEEGGDPVGFEAEEYDMRANITAFRETVGNFLQWGAAYYPWLETTIVSAGELDFSNISNIGTAAQIVDFGEDDKKKPTLDEDEVKEQRTSFENGDTDATLIRLLDLALNQDVLAQRVSPARAGEIKQALKDLAALSAPAAPAAPADGAAPPPADGGGTTPAAPDGGGATPAAPAGGGTPAPRKIDPVQLHQTLLAVSPMYKDVLADLKKAVNTLPPSAAMAGIYSMIDNTVGVFQSPANVNVGSVIRPVVSITGNQQDDLNLPLNGKAVNAIRTFPGKGVLVWGARTLDGNSQDWRYISVRRTVIFIEQSIKYAAEAYVFEPNTAATWTNLKALLTNFLTNVWQQGALAGATAADAFSVDIGLGVTMTPVDILDGIMRVSVKIAVTRPAEFIVITFEQKMQQS